MADCRIDPTVRNSLQLDGGDRWAAMLLAKAKRQRGSEQAMCLLRRTRPDATKRVGRAEVTEPAVARPHIALLLPVSVESDPPRPACSIVPD